MHMSHEIDDPYLKSRLLSQPEKYHTAIVFQEMQEVKTKRHNFCFSCLNIFVCTASLGVSK